MRVLWVEVVGVGVRKKRVLLSVTTAFTHAFIHQPKHLLSHLLLTPAPPPPPGPPRTKLIIYGICQSAGGCESMADSWPALLMPRFFLLTLSFSLLLLLTL